MAKKSKPKSEIKTLKYVEDVQALQKDKDKLSKAEKDLIVKMRSYNTFDKFPKDIQDMFARSDEAQVAVDNAKYFIKIRLLRMDEFNLLKLQNQKQIDGEIWRTVDEHHPVPLTKEELMVENKRYDLEIEKLVQDVRAYLVQTMHYVDQVRMDRKTIIEKEDYENYVYDLKKTIKDKTGFELL